MEQFLTYELAPQPPSLFLDSAMRKPTKSALGNLLKSFVSIQTNLPNTALVIDGGHLLQTVVWSQPSTYRAVCQCYVAYILKHSGTGTIVVFDGYTTVSTKSAEQLRRAKKATSSEIIFVENMQTTTSQTVFLANSQNKSRLIVMLNDVGIQTVQAPADADALIVSTALAVAETPKTVIVVGTDTGLLVMLVPLSAPNMDLYMLCSRNPFILHSINDIRTSIGDTREYMLVLHAIKGCDTVSALCRIGKRKPFNPLHNKREYGMMNLFLNSDSTHEEIQRAGESFLLKLYGASKCASLCYKKAVTKTSLSSSSQLATLPPTSAAAKQHSFRTYFTVQEWIGRSLQSTDWRWKLEDILTPIDSDPPIAPETFLNMISCGCKADGCGVSCGCRKTGVHSSTLCANCCGQTCNNVAPAPLLNENDNDERSNTDDEDDD